ncbi:hypothetical protein RJ639_012577 [Escallonia herrerae]|uniref:Transposase-associated domain-containing protein n=1 Tax=Escallonia herrerae TaxID=1293975 RepID=A0AA89AP38_9ASTE|nr:hypothetical protein RJ639_012577 [Escallonia herrerae]
MALHRRCWFVLLRPMLYLNKKYYGQQMDDICCASVDMVLDFAFTNAATTLTEILCTCRDCLNSMFCTREIVREHLTIRGFMSNSTLWTVHGEASSSCSNRTRNNIELNFRGGGDYKGLEVNMNDII